MPAPIRNIAVIGAGHVGAPHAIVVASKCPTVKVTVVDQDARKIAAWNSSLLPFFEPGMQETLEDVRGVNLTFSTNVAKAIAEADMILVSVSTPLKQSGVGAGFAPDLVFWEKMARLIAATCKTPKVIVERSTVPVKTAGAMAEVLRANSGGQEWTVLSNPEFAREGNAMMDHASPERVLIGAEPTEAGTAGAEALASLYKTWVPEGRVLVSGLWSAELAKIAGDAFLAQRVSSINSISALCENTGADVNEVSYAVGVDSRIGRKCLNASVGFGGTCYETHIRNLVYLCRHYRLHQVASYWESVIKMNEWQKKRFATKIVASMFNTVSGKKLAVLGFAYKKNTSDTRFSAAIDVCQALLAERANLSIYDPRVSKEAISVALTTQDGAESYIHAEPTALSACTGAHAIVVLTEWDEFTRLDFRSIFATMQKPAFVFDGRNILDHQALRDIGFIVYGIGIPPPRPAEPTPEAVQAAAIAEVAARARVRAGAARPDSAPPTSPALSPELRPELSGEDSAGDLMGELNRSPPDLSPLALGEGETAMKSLGSFGSMAA